MSRPRQPLSVARATGAVSKNPARYVGRSEPSSEQLGSASPCLSELQRKAWGAFCREMPWLKESDRALAEVASILRATVWLGDVDTKTIAQLRMCLSAMGATPVDRSKIKAPLDSEPDPSDDFLN